MAKKTRTMAPTNAAVRLADHGFSGSALPTRQTAQRYRAVTPPMSTLGGNAIAVAPRLPQMSGSGTSANKASDMLFTASCSCRPAPWTSSYDSRSSSSFGSVATSASEGDRARVERRAIPKVDPLYRNVLCIPVLWIPTPWPLATGLDRYVGQDHAGQLGRDHSDAHAVDEQPGRHHSRAHRHAEGEAQPDDADHLESQTEPGHSPRPDPPLDVGGAPSDEECAKGQGQ